MNYANNQPMPDASYTLDMLSRRFAGRGLAAGAKTSVKNTPMMSERRIMREYAEPMTAAAVKHTAPKANYSASAVYGTSASHPLTLGEFENIYRAHSEHYGTIRAAAEYKEAKASQSTQPVQRTSAKRTPSATEVKTSPEAHRAQILQTPAKVQRTAEVRPVRTEKKKTQSTAIVRKENAPLVRRAVKEEKKNGISSLGTIATNFRHLPVATILVVVACAVSLMFIVGSSVMLSDASNEFVKLQNEVADLAKEESELQTALEMKNNLRTIEDIAVNKLGMVNKDLVSKQYVSLGDKDVIENYDAEDTNVGLSTLLTAIRGGN